MNTSYFCYIDHIFKLKYVLYIILYNLHKFIIIAITMSLYKLLFQNNF